MKRYPAIQQLITLISILLLCTGISYGVEDQVILVKGDHKYPPYEYLNKDGMPDGFNVDIIRAVAKQMGMHIEIELGPWDTVRKELEEGKTDVLMGMFNTKERDKVVDFSIPHFIASYAVFVPKGSKIKSLEDANGKTIIVQKGDLGHDYIVNKRISDQVILKTNIDEVLRALSDGEGDCAVASRLQGQIILKENKIDRILPVGPPIIQRKYCLAVTEGDSELLAKLNEGLSILKTTGEYDKIYNNWYGIYNQETISVTKISRYLMMISGPLLLLISIIFLWTWSLKKRVALRTAELAESNTELSKMVLERTRAEEDLRKAKRYIANIINSMPSMLIGLNPDGTITQWNTGAEKKTGISPAAAEGKQLVSVLPYLEPEMSLVQEAMTKGENRSVSGKSRLESGDCFFEDITVFPLTDDGMDGAVIRIDDVTEKKRLEEMVIQSEKVLFIGGLAAGIAHEINNPLAGMLQTTEVITSRLTEMSLPATTKTLSETGISAEALTAFLETREIPRMLSSVTASGKRISEIVGNMLGFARDDSAHRSSHDIPNLLDKTLELAATDYDLKKQYDFKTIEIVREYEDNIPPVPCEETKIQQVILNILRNGAQAMLDQETPTRSPRITARVAYDKKIEMVRIELEDNGPGMPETIRERIFEPFYTTKPIGVGTGLGLSISFFIIVEKHGGSLNVESAHGQGACFIIQLPIQGRPLPPKSEA